MDLLTFKYFLTVAKELSITRAAQKLNISPQALSTRISKMEDYYKNTFFERSANFSLTHAGQRMVEFAQDIENLGNYVENYMCDISELRRGQLSVGISRSYARIILPKLLPVFDKHFPHYQLQFYCGNMITDFRLHTLLTGNKVSLIIGHFFYKNSDITYETLFTDELSLVVSRELFGQMFPQDTDTKIREFSKGADIHKFENVRFILPNRELQYRHIIDAFFSQQGFTPNIWLEFQDSPTMCSLVRQGLGATITFKRITLDYFPNADDLYLFPINSTLFDLSIQIGYLKNQYLPQPAKDFLELAKTMEY